MADIDTDHFGDYDKTGSHPDDSGETIPFIPGRTMEDPLGNQYMNKKHRLEEGKLKKEGSPILTSTVCTSSYLSIIDKPQMQPFTITSDTKVSRFISKAGLSQSPMGMKY